MSNTTFNTVWERLEGLSLLLLTDSKFPSVTTIVSGSPITGSWWSHPKGHAIFAVAESLSEHADVVTTKLLSGKVTFVHREMWPALLAVGTARAPWQLRGLAESAREVLRYVSRIGTVRTDEIPSGLRPRKEPIGDAVRALERGLLLHSEEIHTKSGAHTKILETWDQWARRSGAPEPRDSAAAAQRELETLVGRINGQFGANARLPWT